MKTYILPLLMMMLISCSNSKTQDNESTTVSLPEGKEIYIPKDLRSMDLQDPESKWSYHRMVCTENFVIFWEKGFGDNLSDPPQLEGHSMKVNLKNLEEKLEHFLPLFLSHITIRQNRIKMRQIPHDGYDQLFTGRNRLWWRL